MALDVLCLVTSTRSKGKPPKSILVYTMSGSIDRVLQKDHGGGM